MADENQSEVRVKTNPDGTTTRVVVKRMAVKVKPKAPEPEPPKAPEPAAPVAEVKAEPAPSAPAGEPAPETKPATSAAPTTPVTGASVMNRFGNPNRPVGPYAPGGRFGGSRPGPRPPGTPGAPAAKTAAPSPSMAPRGTPGNVPPGGRAPAGAVGPDGKRKIYIGPARKPGAPGGRPGAPGPVPPSQGGPSRAGDRRKVHADKKEKKEVDKLDPDFLRRAQEDEFSNVPERIEIPEVISLKNLAMKLNLKVAQVIKKFVDLGVMDLTVNDSIDHESASILCHELKVEVKVTSLLELTKVEEDRGRDEDYVPRDPIVTVMGHVDHGKTSLLDAIRNANVAAGESGGITQHIAAYKVSVDKGSLLFIDTPGHSAFSAMRSRGAQVTDVVILVVSGIEGVQPQTLEAVQHAKAAQVPIVVAVNKMDVAGANSERVMQQLAEQNVLSEKWGGDVPFVEVSALKKTGLKELLEAVLLVAEVRELKANPKVRASGTVIESRIEQGRGHCATVIIRNGTLKPGSIYLSGLFYGRVRAFYSDRGDELKTAGPSTPIEIIGLGGLPNAGEPFVEMENEKEAKKVAERREELLRENASQNVKKVTLSNLFDTMAQQAVKELKVILKGDVFGTVEALKELLAKQRTDEVKVTVISSGTGAINEADVRMAMASKALILGFKVRPNPKARKEAELEKVDVRTYQVIYDLIDDVGKALKGMLENERREEKLGALKVKEVFRITGVGRVAGCQVIEGKILRDAKLRLYREDVLIYEGAVAMLKHFKEEVKEIAAPMECGVQIAGFQDLKVGDVVESYRVIETERVLNLPT